MPVPHGIVARAFLPVLIVDRQEAVCGKINRV